MIVLDRLSILIRIYYLVPLVLLVNLFLANIVYELVVSVIVLVILINSWVIQIVKHRIVSPIPWVITLSILIGYHVYQLLAEFSALIIFNTEYFLGLMYSIIGLGLMYYISMRYSEEEYYLTLQRSRAKLAISILVLIGILTYISYNILVNKLRIPLFYVLVGPAIDTLLLTSLRRDFPSYSFSSIVYSMYMAILYMMVNYLLILMSLTIMLLEYIVGSIKKTLLYTYAIRITILLLSLIGAFMYGIA